jgi:hypothetical protein
MGIRPFIIHINLGGVLKITPEINTTYVGGRTILNILGRIIYLFLREHLVLGKQLYETIQRNNG